MKKKLTGLNFIFVCAALLCTQTLKAQVDWHVAGNGGSAATNYVGTSDSMKLDFKTANVVRMHINGTQAAYTGKVGFVGIGTAAPATMLHVSGVITATGGTSTAWNTAVTRVPAGTTSKVPRWSGTAYVAGSIFDNATNVGIGTTAPTQKLHVVGNILTSGTVTATGGNSTNWNTSFTRIGGAFTTNYVPKWNGTKFVSGILYDNGTSIGIGNTAPIANLHITPNSSIFALRIDQGVNGQGMLTYVNTTDPAKIVMAAASNATGLYVMGDGHTSIGAGSAPSRLTVSDAATSAPVLDVTNTTTGVNTDVRGIRTSSVMNPGWGYGVEATGGFIGVYGSGNATTYTSFGYGVFGVASGSAGTRVGVYGSASNSGGEAWGGYFATKTYATELRVGGTQGATGYVACINGKLIATEVRVALQASWPDYVFDNSYKLMSIHELEQSIKSTNHLPGLPSACEVEENGIQLGSMQTQIVEKLEESHLYIIQLQKQIDELNAKLNSLVAKGGK